MRFSFLVVATSLTASMIVSACGQNNADCQKSADCCPHYQCISPPARLRKETQERSARTMSEVEPGARVVHRDSEPCFCFRFGIMVDGAISSSESISVVVCGEIFVLLEQCRCLNLSENDRLCLVFLVVH
ncbi:hypothetical protein BDR06DRAFT_958366 [Suillus hirtellus]|nr:hypothetical protein BDR06DRAFT_958366 [Suillus hirtellus]